MQIEKDVQIPEERFTISKLKPGESFLFPTEKQATIASNASRTKKATKKEFTIRKVDSYYS